VTNGADDVTISAGAATGSGDYFLSIRCQSTGSAIVAENFAGAPTMGNILTGGCTINIPAGNFTDPALVHCSATNHVTIEANILTAVASSSSSTLYVRCIKHDGTICSSFEARVRCKQF